MDAEGGDHAPEEIVAGALEVASSTLRVLLVGRPEVIEPLLAGAARDYVELVPSGSVIKSDFEPASAVKNMQDSSIVVGARTVSEGRSQGFVSAGSTGAMLAAALLLVKRAGNIRRPAIVTTLPGLEGPVVFLDAGANADCRPEHLLEFGVLGTAYARTVLGIASPRVGLLNIGEEKSKGSELARAAHGMLELSGLNFVGNVEGRDLLKNTADVVVTDGFTGNVALKLLEGCSSSLFTRMKEAAASGTRAKLGGMLLRPALRRLRADLDPEEYGGTYLLGVRGLVVICHGNSSRRAIANALRFGAEALRKGVLPGVDEELARITRDLGPSADSAAS
ncbi:MAG: phosphate acyltransferase PlsX [Actinobacteria bacterium RBG_16_64_13]|nr:MAG: phosphate acyltransferase PlsX [Actinobacteria bacterium RBG_16_64_13]